MAKKKQKKKLPEKPSHRRNKELTKRSLIQAVGDIIDAEGYRGLGVNKIARTAGVDKQLIYRYFDSAEKLIEQYILEKDFWTTFSKQLQELPQDNSGENLQNLVKSILQNQYRFFQDAAEMQRLILWEITERTTLMDGVSNAREVMGSEFLKLTDRHFHDSDINFRGISALLVAGIYYLVLHSKTNTSTFCGLNLKTKEGREEIIKSISKVIDLVFKDLKQTE